MNPFRLDTRHGATLDGDAINDPIHDWAPQHRAWNGGAMDQWVNVHIAANGVANGPVTMGYYTRADIPIHRALAERSRSATLLLLGARADRPEPVVLDDRHIDPDGTRRPAARNDLGPARTTVFAGPTYPEQLQNVGVSWKVYQDRAARDLARGSS